MARGGNRTPRTPAPVSGPGALSQRTDGGPGSDTQPIRVPTGGDYGSATASRNAQRAAPLPDNTGIGGGEGGAGVPAPPPSGVFGPTDRPYEAPTAGLNPGGQTPYEVEDAIRALWSVFPHPQLLALLRNPS